MKFITWLRRKLSCGIDVQKKKSSTEKKTSSSKKPLGKH